jgi:polyisoprenoid-binding protein YceI
MRLSLPKTPAPAPGQLPPPGRWDIDPAHTTIGFWARHLGVAKVRGTFRSFAGTVHIAEDPALASVSVTIDAASIDTRERPRDEHLRSPDFLDVANYPALTFVSTSVEGSGTRWTIRGDLTIRDVTRPVTLDVEFDGVQPDDDVLRAFFTASTVFDRTDFGLTWNQAIETGGVLVGNDIHIDLDVELVRPR